MIAMIINICFVSGEMGCTNEDVQRYELTADPPKQLLYDWNCKSKDSSLERFIVLLKQIERVDIISEIHEHFKITESSLDTGKSEQSNTENGRSRTDSAEEDTQLWSSDSNNVQSLRVVQVDMQDSMGRTSSYSNQPTGSTPPSQRGGAMYANEGSDSGSRSSASITFGKRGVSNLTVTDDSVGYNANVGVTLNSVEGMAQTGSGTEPNITPVE